MKKVLIIAYIFPPLGGSGVQRSLKFVKYLPQFGWQPFVVCGDDEEVFSDGYDPTLLAEIPPEAQVWRQPFISPLGLRRGVQRALHIKSLKEIHSEVQAAPVWKDVQANGYKPGLMRRAAQLLTAPLGPIEFPLIDAALYWALSIVPLCRKIIHQEQIDLIYTTSFPYSDHLAGYLLKRLTGKPWIADFRDPWSQNPFARNQGWRRRVDEAVERRVLSYADKIIGVTPTYTQQLRKLIPKRGDSDFITIPNGYDTDDFNHSDQQSKGINTSSDKRTLGHFGFVYDGIALPVLNALTQLPSSAAEKLQVHFIGGMPAGELEWARAALPEGLVSIRGRISHDIAVQLMQKTDVLLLLIRNQPTWKGHYPGKLFEYMASGRPILMIGPDGEAAKLVRESGTGYTVTGGVNEIVDALHWIASDLDAFKQKSYHPKADVIGRYSRKALTHQLAGIFTKLVH
jgi:glycosyltransferase involved in cell wall biosynthesis